MSPGLHQSTLLELLVHTLEQKWHHSNLETTVGLNWRLNPYQSPDDRLWWNSEFNSERVVSSKIPRLMPRSVWVRAKGRWGCRSLENSKHYQATCLSCFDPPPKPCPHLLGHSSSLIGTVEFVFNNQIQGSGLIICHKESVCAQESFCCWTHGTTLIRWSICLSLSLDIK